jgi:hypothetical protein
MISVTNKYPRHLGEKMSLDPTGASKTARGIHGPTESVVFGYTSTRLDHDSANNQRWMCFHEHLVWELTCFGV